MLKTVTGAVVQVAEGVGNIVGGIRVGTEEPAFTVERVVDGVEIRRYGPASRPRRRSMPMRSRPAVRFFSVAGALHLRRQFRQRQDRDDRAGGPTAQREDRDDRAGRDATQRLWRVGHPLLHAVEVHPGDLAHPPNDDRVQLVVVPPPRPWRCCGSTAASARTRSPSAPASS